MRIPVPESQKQKYANKKLNNFKIGGSWRKSVFKPQKKACYMFSLY